MCLSSTTEVCVLMYVRFHAGCFFRGLLYSSADLAGNSITKVEGECGCVAVASLCDDNQWRSSVPAGDHGLKHRRTAVTRDTQI